MFCDFMHILNKGLYKVELVCVTTQKKVFKKEK